MLLSSVDFHYCPHGGAHSNKNHCLFHHTTLLSESSRHGIGTNRSDRIGVVVIRVIVIDLIAFVTVFDLVAWLAGRLGMLMRSEAE